MTATKGFVVPAGGGKRLDSPTQGRFFDLKLLGHETDESIMMFEETLPAGTASLFHLHRDSDEVAWVLAGEFTFKDRRRGHRRRARHLRVHAARRPACAWTRSPHACIAAKCGGIIMTRGVCSLLRARPPQSACDWQVETKSNIGVGAQRDATDACIDERAFEG